MDVDRGSSILKRSWRVRVRRLEPLDAEMLDELERQLAQLERLGARGFNVYQSHYEPQTPATETVQRLRLLGATSGISLEGGPHLRVSTERPQYIGS